MIEYLCKMPKKSNLLDKFVLMMYTNLVNKAELCVLTVRQCLNGQYVNDFLQFINVAAVILCVLCECGYFLHSFLFQTLFIVGGA